MLPLWLWYLLPSYLLFIYDYQTIILGPESLKSREMLANLAFCDCDKMPVIVNL